MAELIFSGGVNEQDNTKVDPRECIAGYNFELGAEDTHFKNRKPFDLVGTAPNNGTLNGIMQLVKRDYTKYTLLQCYDTCYAFDGTTFTSKGTVDPTSKLRDVTWSLGDYIIITDLSKKTVVKQYDGTTFSTLTTGLGVSLYAKFGIVHLGRVWLFNVKAGADTPHLMVASQFETPTVYDTSKRSKDSTFVTGNEAFYMVTPDLLPINGVAFFYGNLIVSTENGRLYKLSGTDAKTFQWDPYYPNSNVVSDEAMINVGDDVMFMKKGGVIESLRTTNLAGDVKTYDLSKWIRTTTSGLTSAITVYDQTRQKVHFFVGGKDLVLFKDMLPTGLSPWSIYKTNHSSGFNVTSAKYMIDPVTTSYYVFFGDSAGKIYRMDGTSAGDAGTSQISCYRKSKYLDNLGSEQGISGRVDYRRISTVSLTMSFEWAEDYAITNSVLQLDGPPVNDSGYYWGSFYWGNMYWNSGFFYSQRISSKGYAPVGRSPGIYLSLYLDTTSNFDIIRVTDGQEPTQQTLPPQQAGY